MGVAGSCAPERSETFDRRRWGLGPPGAFGEQGDGLIADTAMLGRSFRQGRFLVALVATNFAVVPTLVAVLLAFARTRWCA